MIQAKIHEKLLHEKLAHEQTAKGSSNMTALLPFSAIIGQSDLKLALILNAVNPKISGVLIRGEKGTAFCLDVGVDGHRGDIIILKTAKTLAAWEGRTSVEKSDIETAAQLALPHRIRRKPLQEVAHDIHAVRETNRAQHAKRA